MFNPSMDEAEFQRYSRQLLLDEIGLAGQQKLKQSSVLIVGLGGLGAQASTWLAAAGVGTLLLADDDNLHLSNLHRQIIYCTSDIHQEKARLAVQQLKKLNPLVKLAAITERLQDQALEEAVMKADLILDCTDNMTARHAINTACVITQKPLISGSAINFSGQLMVIEPPWTQGCYACLYPNHTGLGNCHTAGIMGPVAGIIGTLQALEAIKLLTGLASLSGKLLLFDGKKYCWDILQLSKAIHCPVCGEA